MNLLQVFDVHKALALGRSVVQWGATHVYAATLLPATETDRLKDSGKIKDHLPLQSGAAISIGVGQDTTLPAYEVTGSELVVNGGFDSAASWDAPTGWTIGSGVATANVGNYVAIKQAMPLTAGVRYAVTYTVASISSGSVRPYFFGGTSVVGSTRTVAGTYTDVLQAVSGNISLYISSVGSGFVGTIDNVSVKEITPAQYTAYIKNGTFTETLTADQTSISLTSGNTYSCIMALSEVPTAEQRAFIGAYYERTFAHFNANDTHSESVLVGLTCNLLVNHSVNGYLIDYSKAFGVELASQLATGYGGWASSTLAQVGSAIRSTQSVGQSYCGISRTGLDPVPGEVYWCRFSITTSANATIAIYNGSTYQTVGTTTAGVGLQINTVIGITANYTSLPFRVAGMTAGQYADFSAISIMKLTAHQITNWTTACDLKQQSTGVQLISFQKSGGVIGLYKPLAMWFDGNSYVNRVDTGWKPSSTASWAVEVIQIKSAATLDLELSGVTSGTNQKFYLGRGATTDKAYFRIGEVAASHTGCTEITHLIAEYSHTTKKIKCYINGVLKGELGDGNYSTTTSNVLLGLWYGATYPLLNPATYWKTWIGDQYAKFDPAKSWAAAQKIITQLEAM